MKKDLSQLIPTNLSIMLAVSSKYNLMNNLDVMEDDKLPPLLASAFNLDEVIRADRKSK